MKIRISYAKNWIVTWGNKKYSEEREFDLNFDSIWKTEQACFTGNQKSSTYPDHDLTLNPGGRYIYDQAQHRRGQKKKKKLPDIWSYWPRASYAVDLLTKERLN